MTTAWLQSRRAFSTIIFAVLFLSNWFCVVVVAQSGTSDRNATDRLYCSVGQFGFFADQKNCSRYVQCYDGRLTRIHQCSVGLHWHVTGLGFGYCKLPKLAGCQMTPAPDPIDPPPVEQFVCPRTLLCNRKSVDGQYGDPFNCSRFYLCIDGQSFVSNCPTGMSWSERAGHCDWSYLAHCDLRLLQRYGLVCVNYSTSDQLTTDARQSSDVSNTITDCAMNDCSLATYDSTTSSNLMSSTSEASGITLRLFAMHIIALVNLIHMSWPDRRIELFLA